MPRSYVGSDADVSPCGTYRYVLTRRWEPRDKEFALVIGLNPSTADATRDDPTIRRCVRFANREGYTTLVMMNLFAFRATRPLYLKSFAAGRGDVIGPRNDRLLVKHAKRASLVIAAWGIHGSLLGRDSAVIELMYRHRVKLMCLGRAATGHPRHPLMLRADTPLTLFSIGG